MRVCVVLMLLCLTWLSAAAGPLDEPAFTAPPAALLAAAAPELSGEAPVVVLREDVHYTLDERGRATTRIRMVLVIVKPAAVDDWGTVFHDWKPFYQERPTIRARVISRDGKVAELDPSLIHDDPAKSESATIFSDRRQMKAPLPRLTVGAVVEEEFVTVDREPLLDAGVVDRDYLSREVPVRRAVVTIDAPSKLATRVAVRGLPRGPTPRKTTRGARTIWTFDASNLAADEGQFRFGVPPESTLDAYVTFSTAASWTAVATSYDKLVAARLAEPFTPPTGLSGATPRETVDRVLAWLHANVRYTGIELADSAIIPHAPAQTVARGFGDCKDKATLLVALLRAARIDAHVALLSTGPGSDVDADLPGMGMFDHAIVRVRVDGKDLWIDATEEDLPAGQLPVRDQGRRALIVAPGTRGLVTTPGGRAADNLIREVRTYHLAELDFGRVTEVTREHGVFRDGMRSFIRDAPRDEVAANLRTYAEQQYNGQLVSFHGTPDPKVTEPFDLTIEIEEVKRAHSDRERIDVFLFPSDVTGRLGDAVLDTSPETSDALSRRTLDYVWALPQVYEIENRLLIPDGFDVPTLTASEQRPLGTMTLTTTRRRDGRTLVITYRLDSGRSRISAAELRATRDAVKALREQDAEHVVIAQTGATLLAKGKLREAIAEYQRMIALHPREALHHGQLAEAYRRAGMNPAARRAARAGVTVEPTASDAYAQLAFQLRRDSVGREHGFDADRAGAIAAYRKALTLDPNHQGALEDFASLLAVDAAGWPSLSAADLREAAALMQRLHQLSEQDAHLLTAAEYLLGAGDFAAAEAAARRLPASVQRSGLLIAAVAAGKSPRDALALASTLASGDARTQLVVAARGRLFQIGRYEPMRALHAELAPAASGSAQHAMINAIKNNDVTRLDRMDPRRPVLHWLMMFLGIPATSAPWDKTTAAEVEDKLRGEARKHQVPRTMPAAVMLDTVVAGLPVTIDGDARRGWTASVTYQGSKMALYLARGATGAELVAASGMPGGFGRQIRAALARKDLPAATLWLDRVDDGDADGSLPIMAAATLYKHATASGGAVSRDVLEVAGAMLISHSDPAAAIPVLRRCNVDHDLSKRACKMLLLGALVSRKDWKAVAEWVRQLEDAGPDASVDRAVYLARAGAAAEGLTVLDEVVRKHPGDEWAIMMRAILVIETEGWTAAQAGLDRSAARPTATTQVLNELAWLRLFHDATPDRARELGLRAERASPSMSPALANTMAAVEAEAGNLQQALVYLSKAHAHLLSEPPHEADWYVIGRIAEQLGLRDDAIAAYRRVTPSDPLPGRPTVHDFAQKALKRLGAAPK